MKQILVAVAVFTSTVVHAGKDVCISTGTSGYPKVTIYFDSKVNVVTGMESQNKNRKKIVYEKIQSQLLPYKTPKAANFTGISKSPLEIGMVVLHIFPEHSDRALGAFTSYSGGKVSIAVLECKHES